MYYHKCNSIQSSVSLRYGLSNINIHGRVHAGPWSPHLYRSGVIISRALRVDVARSERSAFLYLSRGISACYFCLRRALCGIVMWPRQSRHPWITELHALSSCSSGRQYIFFMLHHPFWVPCTRGSCTLVLVVYFSRTFFFGVLLIPICWVVTSSVFFQP